MGYQFETEKVVDFILKNSVKKVLIQLPEGLKPYGVGLAKEIEEKAGVTAYVSADPCYGACDLPIQEAEILNVDLIIHYGHSEILKEAQKRIKILYVEAKSNLDIGKVVEKSLPFLKEYRNIGLVATVQHVHKLEEAKKILEKNGKKVFIGSASGLVKYDGQVLGCDCSTAEKIKDKVEVFLYIGGGIFHPLGVFYTTKKPVIMVDPYTEKILNVKEIGEKFLKRRNTIIAKFSQAKNVGVLVGLKFGQSNPQLAEKICRKLREKGRNPVLICLREIIPENLDNFPQVEAFVNTACPRVGFDDDFKFRKPIISVKEFFEVFKNDP